MSVSQTVSWSQDSVLWCGTIPVLCLDEKRQEGLPFSGLLLQGVSLFVVVVLINKKGLSFKRKYFLTSETSSSLGNRFHEPLRHDAWLVLCSLHWLVCFSRCLLENLLFRVSRKRRKLRASLNDNRQIQQRQRNVHIENKKARRKDWTRPPVLDFPLFYWSIQFWDLRAPSLLSSRSLSLLNELKKEISLRLLYI